MTKEELRQYLLESFTSEEELIGFFKFALEKFFEERK